MRAFAEATAEPDRLLAAIAEHTARALEAHCGVAMVSADATRLESVALSETDREREGIVRQFVGAHPLPLASPLVQSALQTNGTVVAMTPEHLRTRFTDPVAHAAAVALEITDVLLVPVRAQGTLVGMLSLARQGRDAKRFDADDVALAQDIAGNAAFVLSNAQLVAGMRKELAERERRLRALTELAAEFSAATLDYQRLLDLFTRRTGELIGDLSSIRWVSDDGEWLEPTESLYHVDSELAHGLRDALRGRRTRVGEGLPGRVAATGEPILMSTVTPEQIAATVEDRNRELVLRLGIRSVLVAPLYSHGKVIGVASMSRSTGTPYTTEDLQLFQDIAGHAALAIANARLFARNQAELAERRRLTDRLQLLSELAQEFAAGASDYDALLALVARRLGEVLGDGCSILMISSDGEHLETPGYTYNRDPEQLAHLAQLMGTRPVRLGEGVTGRVAATGIPVFIPTIDLEQIVAAIGEPYREIATRAGIKSMVVVPLRSNERVIGVCNMYRTHDSPSYSDDERRFIEDLVAHASLAITNSSLLEAGKRELAERMKTQEVLRRGFLEAAPDAVLIVDTAGRILLVNTQTETLFGYARSELIGQPIEVLVPERFRAHHPANRASYVGSPMTRPMGAGLNLFALRKDGSQFAAEISLSPIETPEGTLVAAAVRDVTERRRDLEERNRRMQEANRLKSEFLANMSHELRTPLNAVIGFAALMHAGKTGPMADIHKEYIGDILTSSRHLLQLINDVLDLAKVESGRMDVHVESTDVPKTVGEVRDIVRGLASERNIRVGVELDREISKVVVDPRLLKQVLYNYLSNAIKFTRDGGRVTLRIKPAGDDAFAIEVEDTGIGIRAEDMERLFVEFQQLDSGTTKRYPGTGLGLALTKRIVEAQGGRVTVTSVHGEGSTFSAILPREVRLDHGG